jgi:hypothetical protein
MKMGDTRYIAMRAIWLMHMNPISLFYSIQIMKNSIQIIFNKQIVGTSTIQTLKSKYINRTIIF